VKEMDDNVFSIGWQYVGHMPEQAREEAQKQAKEKNLKWRGTVKVSVIIRDGKPYTKIEAVEGTISDCYHDFESKVGKIDSIF
jgi:hypothetical protein